MSRYGLVFLSMLMFAGGCGNELSVPMIRCYHLGENPPGVTEEKLYGS